MQKKNEKTKNKHFFFFLSLNKNVISPTNKKLRKKC